MGISLDGYVASDREHPGVSVPEDAELIRWKLDRVAKAGAHLMGRATYQEMAAYWPRSTAPVRGADERYPQGRLLPDAQPGFLAHHPDSPWRPGRGDRRAETGARAGCHRPRWRQLRRGPGRPRAIDEYCLVIQPVAVGRGQALFAELPAALPLELIEARSFECGVVVHIYRPRNR